MEKDFLEEPEKKAGVFTLICSVLFPIVGIIAYFVQRKSVSNPSAYLFAALAGFILSLILRSMMIAKGGY